MQVYYNILEMIRTQLLGDVNVNTVTTGDIFDVDLDKQTIFPLSHVMVNQATRKDRVYTLNISVLLMDIVDKVNHEATDKFRGNDNEQDVFNTQLSVGGRLVEMLKRGDLRDDNFELTNDPNFEPFTERFENSLAGWALTFDVDVPNTMTVCDVPIVPPSCLAADYSIIDEDGNVLYSGSIASGGSLEQEIQNSTAIVKNSEGTTQSTTEILAEGTETITANDALISLLNSDGTVIGGDSFPSGTANNMTAPDATIKNSLGTTLDSAPSGADTVLPDIPNVDSDGSTVNTPAQVPFVCTPAAGASIGKKPMKTGQTTSYYTDDDGATQRGRDVDFFTLDGNNAFGNSNRFTDLLGTQIYSNGSVMLDHSTDDGSEILGITYGYYGTFTNVLDYINNNLSTDGKTDWALINRAELERLIYEESIRNLNWSPLNQITIYTGSDLNWWTSTSPLNNTARAKAFFNSSGVAGNQMTTIGKTGASRSLAVRYYTYAELGL